MKISAFFCPMVFYAIQVTLTVNRLYGSVGRVEVRYSTQSASAQGNIDYRSIRGGVAEMNEGVVSATFNIEVSETLKFSYRPQKNQSNLAMLLNLYVCVRCCLALVVLNEQFIQ